MVVWRPSYCECFDAVGDERAARVGSNVHYAPVAEGAISVQFQSNGPFSSSYTVNLLLFWDVHNVLSVSYFCCSTLLHIWMGQLVSNVAMQELMWSFANLITGFAAFVLWRCTSTSYIGVYWMLRRLWVE